MIESTMPRVDARPGPSSDPGATHPADNAIAPASVRPLGFELEVPTGRGFIALLEAFRASGGTAPAEIVGRLLEEHRVGTAVSLAGLVHTGRVFGFRWRACLWLPMFQFDSDDLALKVGAQRVRAVLPSGWSGWTLASWFAHPNAKLGGRSPVDKIDLDVDAVMRAARSLAPLDEPALAPLRRARVVAAHV